MIPDELIKKGDIIELEDGNPVYADIPEHFAYNNRLGCWDLTRTLITIGDKYRYPRGAYIVVKTVRDGGGTSYDGTFPNGHHVFCVNAENEKLKVDFYQTGNFTAMIERPKIIGKAELRWTLPRGQVTDD